MADELTRMLKGLLGNGFDGEKDDDDEEETTISISKQKTVLEELVGMKIGPEFVVGAYVDRNSLGKRRYLYPKEGEVAIITHVFDTPQIEHNNGPSNVVHGEIVCCKQNNGKIKLATATVNFRYFKVVSHAPKDSDDE